MTDNEQILLTLIAAKLPKWEQAPDPAEGVAEMRLWLNVIKEKSEANVLVSQRMPEGTPESPWKGMVFIATSPPRWVYATYDGSKFQFLEKDDTSKDDVIEAVTYWKKIENP